MAKMTKAQRNVILDFHNGVNAKGDTMVIQNNRTINALVREGWARRSRPAPGGRIDVEHVHVTTAGLIAAGVDMDALAAQAADETR